MMCGAIPLTSRRAWKRQASPTAYSPPRRLPRSLGDDFVLDGPQKITTKEERVLEAFFVDRRS